MVTQLLHHLGLRGWHFHALSTASVGLCIGLWIRAKTVDQDERGNAERRALFVGPWSPLLWDVGTSLELDRRLPAPRERVRRRAGQRATASAPGGPPWTGTRRRPRHELLERHARRR